MVNRKIRFVWDLGGGVAELTHHLHIQTAGDLQRDQHWYKIDVERYNELMNSLMLCTLHEFHSPCGQKFSKSAHDHRIFYAISADFDADRI